jgi:hypothetical protein
MTYVFDNRQATGFIGLPTHQKETAMGIFSSIKEKLWGKAKDAEATTPTITAEAVKPVGADMSTTSAKPASTESAPAGSGTGGKAATSATAPAATVDVAAIMDAAVKANGQKLDWRHSIVDMMKALDLDSSLAARKELAQELKYTGDLSDSGKMNVWLHKALMKALADNGGKVPAELMD